MCGCERLFPEEKTPRLFHHLRGNHRRTKFRRLNPDDSHVLPAPNIPQDVRFKVARPAEGKIEYTDAFFRLKISFTSVSSSEFCWPESPVAAVFSCSLVRRCPLCEIPASYSQNGYFIGPVSRISAAQLGRWADSRKSRKANTIEAQPVQRSSCHQEQGGLQASSSVHRQTRQHIREEFLVGRFRPWGM
jgi:hypothetical protein